MTIALLAKDCLTITDIRMPFSPGRNFFTKIAIDKKKDILKKIDNDGKYPDKIIFKISVSLRRIILKLKSKKRNEIISIQLQSSR